MTLRKSRFHLLAILSIALSASAEAKSTSKLPAERKTSLGLCTEVRESDRDITVVVDRIDGKTKEAPRFQLQFNIATDENGAGKRIVTDLVTGQLEVKPAPGFMPLAVPKKNWRDKPLALESKSGTAVSMGDDETQLVLNSENLDNMDPLDPGVFMLLDKKNDDTYGGTLKLKFKGTEKTIQVHCKLNRLALAGLDDEKTVAAKALAAAKKNGKSADSATDDEGKHKDAKPTAPTSPNKAKAAMTTATSIPK